MTSGTIHHEWQIFQAGLLECLEFVFVYQDAFEGSIQEHARKPLRLHHAEGFPMQHQLLA